MRKFCTNCGAALNAETRFCGECGAQTDSEITRLASASLQQRPRQNIDTRTSEAEAIERVIFTIHPTLLFIKIGYGAAALGAILLITLLALVPFDVPAYISIPLALSLLLIPAFYHLKRNTVRYTLTDSKVEIDAGLVARTTRNIPLRNIQDVTVSTTIMQRLLGFGDLVIDNASDQTGATYLRNIPNPRHYANLLMNELRRWH